jgi:UDP-2-acetamido-3-amino-2,3-dideoxy-glucuronate N-acetyltransferase
MTVNIHPTAIVCHGAQIGNGLLTWHWVHVCSEDRIGQTGAFGRNALVGQHIIIGDQCKIKHSVSVYDQVSLEGGYIAPDDAVNRDVKPYAGMVGVRVSQMARMSELGGQISFPLEGTRQYTCPHPRTTCFLNGANLRTMPS